MGERVAGGVELPVNKLKAGSYTVDIKAMNSALRTADFEAQ